VEAPTSTTVFPSGETLNCFKACSSLNPPLLENGWGFPIITGRQSSETSRPGLSATASFILTLPARMMARAFSLVVMSFFLPTTGQV